MTDRGDSGLKSSGAPACCAHLADRPAPRPARGRSLALSAALVCLIALVCGNVSAQSEPMAVAGSQAETSRVPGVSAVRPADVQQLAGAMRIEYLLKKVAALRASRACGSAASLEELTAREDLVELVQAAWLDTDSVLAELGNEQSELSELRARLQSRRDKTVGRLNTAALLTGAGLGAIVSATQFTTLSSTTQNTGDALGIGAGVSSTILSLLAASRQNGPSGTITRTPNMLAPLLGREPLSSTLYPAAVLRFLEAVPEDEAPGSLSRLDRLRSEWIQSGRLTAASGKSPSNIPALTTSNDPSVKVSIADISNRIAMLGDVRSRVSLMKRDLATLRRMSLGPPQCASEAR